MSTDLQWILLRNYHSKLVKRTGLKKHLSAEKGNLANTHSFHNNGYIHAKTVDVSPNPSGKGVVLTTRKQKAAPGLVGKARYVQNLKGASARKTNAAVKTTVKNYRPEQATLAVARASGILRSQKASSKKTKAPRVRSAKAKKAAAASTSA
ncbi:ribosomal protein L28e [Cystobasidium minutum MCA 4210]|uniref:ribosomal protein L28e n=1 Tax=Cystobasidium minutum MCA 4210 TaxID=1397322 RepID=UPI0034CD35FB|eukprot:jgi/Rhomi1/211701/estExt_Genemark1.C_5_t10242